MPAILVAALLLVAFVPLAAGSHGYTQDRTATVSKTYHAPPIEGPGQPTQLHPYMPRTVVAEACTPSSVAGQPAPAEQCIRNGGAIWDPCDSAAHAHNGGNPRHDLPCRDPDSAAGPFDTVSVQIDCVTCFIQRKIPYVVLTDSADDDAYYGERFANDGDCSWLACPDFGPGPREVEVFACSEHPAFTPRPSDDTWGTGPGIAQQRLGGEEYLTHHLGSSSTSVDPEDEYRPHPGVDGFAVFLLGPIHGRKGCPTASNFPPVHGEITVTLST